MLTVIPGGPRHRIGGYAEFAPRAEAAAFCEAFWMHYTPRRPQSTGAAHRVLPDLAVSLAFESYRDETGRPTDGRPVIIGPKLRPQIFELRPGRELAAVRLKPEWVGPILGIDPFDIENQVTDLGAVRPVLAARLQETLWETRTAMAAIGVLAGTLIQAPASHARPPAAAIAALDIVRGCAGRIPCERVAGRLGVSMRHLRRQVRDSTGVSPKSYARVLRFVASMQMADAVAHPSWADIAVQAGYCDQSHLIRDCLAMTGASPRDLNVERRRQVLTTL